MLIVTIIVEIFETVNGGVATQDTEEDDERHPARHAQRYVIQVWYEIININIYIAISRLQQRNHYYTKCCAKAIKNNVPIPHQQENSMSISFCYTRADPSPTLVPSTPSVIPHFRILKLNRGFSLYTKNTHAKKPKSSLSSALKKLTPMMASGARARARKQSHKETAA